MPVPSSILVTTNYPPVVGGMEEYYARLAAGLPTGSVAVTTPRVPGWRRVDGDSAVPVSRPPFARSSVHKFAWAIVWWLWLLALIARRRARFLHCGNVTPAGYLGLWTKRLLRIPYALYFHGMDTERAREKMAAGGTRGRTIRRVLDGAAVLFANSRDTAARLERLGLDPARVRLLHPGVDAERFSPGEPRGADVLRFTGRPTLLTVGRYAARKGVDRVLGALPGVRARAGDVQLIVIGRGQEEHLAPLVAERGLGDHVHFPGEVDASRLPDWFRLADVFVMPAREDPATGSVEGFGIVYLEAAACGIPSVAGRSGGVADAVIDGETGLLVDPLDEAALADALVALLADPALRERLGRQGRQRVLAEFEWARFGDVVARELVRLS